MHLAVDGWGVAHKPSGRLAWRAAELLAQLRAHEPDLQVSWITPGPMDAEGHVEQVPVGPGSLGHWRFQQWRLAPAAQRAGADLLLSLEASAPLRSPLPVLIEQTGWPPRESGLAERLRRAMASAGALGAAGRYRWQDLAGVDLGPPPDRLLPPFVASQFRPTAGDDDRGIRLRFDLFDGYVLALEPSRAELELLLAAWTWVDASVGDSHPLVLAGLDPSVADHARHWAASLDLADSLHILPPISWTDLPALLRGAAAMLHPGPSANGQELRWALASGTPVAGIARPLASAVMGDAGYLVAEADSRALGAACLTLLVEQRELAKQLRQKGLLRAMSLHDETAPAALLDYLKQVAER